MNDHDRCPRTGPLAGTRVIDFGHVWAGPYCAATLADLGAEVIKVESSHRLDVHRRQGPYPNKVAGHDSSGVWNAQNRGKRSVTLNLRTKQGRVLARRLVTSADVVVENFRPGVMNRLGLSFDRLSAEHPGLVYVSLSAFGQEGPQSQYVGYGPSLDAWAGLDSLTRYDGQPPQSLGGVFADTGSALYAVVAVISLLINRSRSGRGGYVDLSELEVTSLLIGDTVAEALSGQSQAPSTFPSTWNADVESCIRTSDGLWTFVDTSDEAVVDRLLPRQLPVGADQRSDEGPFADAGTRLQARAATSTRSELIAACTTQNVPAAPVYDVRDVLDDPHLRSRRYFRPIKHARTPTLPVYGPIWRFSHTPVGVAEAAPELGEGNDYVLGKILGLSPDRIDELVARCVVS